MAEITPVGTVYGYSASQGARQTACFGFLKQVEALGGEGVMLRQPEARYAKRVEMGSC